MFNPVHYRKTWESVGKPFDPPAVQRLEAPWSAISLLKSILGATMGIIPPGAVGTEQLAQGAVTLDKIQTIKAHTILARAMDVSGQVQEVQVDGNGIVFDGIDKMMLAPAVGDVTAPIGTRTFTLANRVVGGINVKLFSLDLTEVAAIATPNKLWGTTGAGTTFQWSSGNGILFQNNSISVITGPGGLMPYDQGLAQLAALTTPAIYWLAGPDNWQPVTMGVGMTFSGGVLSSTGSGGGGGISTSGQVVANQIPAYTSSTGTFVRGTNLPPEIILAGDNMQFTGNLAALSGVSGTNTLYYRISNLGWGPVTFSSAFTFGSGNLDLAPGLLRNLNALNPTNNTYPLFHGNDVVTAEPISPFSQVVITSPDAAAWRTAIGAGTPYQLDPDLASISAITATNALIYRVSADTWAPVTIGANLTFTGGTLSATGTAGGNVSAIGSPAANTLAFWTSPTTIDDATLGTGLAFAAGALSLDADLVALAGWTSGVAMKTTGGTWQPLTVGPGLQLPNLTGNLTIADTNLQALMGVGVAAADRLPYYTSATAMALTTLTSFGRSLIASVDAAAARTLLGVPSSANVQPLDADLTSLAAASATNAIYYRSAADTWSTVTIGANLTFSGGVLAATGGGTGTGDVTSSGTGFSTSTLAGYADATGDVIRAVTFPAEGLGMVGSQIVLKNDLAALEAIAVSNVIVYRQAADTWSTVTFSNGISFAGGAISLGANLVALHGLTGAADLGIHFTGVGAMATHPTTTFGRSILNVADAAGARTLIGAQVIHPNLTAFTGLTGAADQVPYFTGPAAMGMFVMTSAMRGLMAQTSAANFLSAIGGQPLDADLTAIAALTGTNTIYYRSAANTWAAVAIGAGLTFTGGQLSATADTTGLAPLDSPAFVGVPTGPTAATATNTTQLATCAYVQANVTNLQPLDGDLTSLAAASSIAIYYRQGTNSWAPVTVGAGLTFTGGTLSATSSGSGDVTSSSGPFALDTLVAYADTTGDLIRPLTLPAAGIGITGSALVLKDDLAALESLTGTNSIYRRSGTNTWSEITYSTGISLNASGMLMLNGALQAYAGATTMSQGMPYFSDATTVAYTPTTAFSRALLAGTDAAAWRSNIGAGDALLAGANVFTNINRFNQPVIYSNPANTYNNGAPFQVHTIDSHADFAPSCWSTNVGFTCRLVFRRSTSGTIGTAGGSSNIGAQMGQIIWQLANPAGGFTTGGMMTCTNQNTLDSSFNPTRYGFYTCSNIGGDGLQERMFVDAYGRFVVGAGGAASPYLEKFQVVGTDLYINMQLDRYSNDGNAGAIYINKSRGASIGSMVPVQVGDNIGHVIWRGVDSNNQHIAAMQMTVYCQNTPSAGVVNGQLRISTSGTDLIVADKFNGINLLGETNGSNALTGCVGEYTASPFTAIAVNAGATNNVANISLTAGDWDIWTNGHMSAPAGGPSLGIVGFNATPSTIPTGSGNSMSIMIPASSSLSCAIRGRANLTATTTIYFVCNAGAQAITFTGAIYARRAR